MGLFNSKVCDICGQKIKLLSNKKLKDGNLCKECANKLSPFFKERKESTISEIQEQLKSREENQKELENYNFNKIFGDYGVILIDEDSKKIAIINETSDGLFKSQRKVKSLEDIKDKNPDIISFDQIKELKIDIKQMTNEEYRIVDGKSVSYDPKRYKYGMDFYIDMEIEHTYIKQARIQLNNGSILIITEGRRREDNYKERFLHDFFGLTRKEDRKVDYEAESFEELISKVTYFLPEYAFGFKVDQFRNATQIKEYASYLAKAEEIKRIIGK